MISLNQINSTQTFIINQSVLFNFRAKRENFFKKLVQICYAACTSLLFILCRSTISYQFTALVMSVIIGLNVYLCSGWLIVINWLDWEAIIDFLINNYKWRQASKNS